MQTVFFLPGAGGSPLFWRPVADQLPNAWQKEHFRWPGLGTQPHDPAVDGIDDLVRLVERRFVAPVDIVAQSMGGVVAARLALSRPEMVRRLVLVVTSAGVNMAQFGSTDWRLEYRKLFPDAAKWITDHRAAAELPVEKITAATLLIWGDADPISPVGVGRHLNQRIANSKLRILGGGDHDLAEERPDEVAALICQHLS